MPLPPALALTIPPQVLATGGDKGLTLTSPLGYVSANAIPASASFGFGFVIVKVSSEVPFETVGLVPNNFAMAGGRMAVNDATAEPLVPEFVPLSVDDMKPLTFVCGPAVVAVTSTLTVQELLAGMPAPVVCAKSSVVDPATGDHDGEPVHVVLAEGIEATCSPAGKLSENLTPVSGAVLGLVSVNCSVDVPPTAIGLDRKDFVIVGGCAVWQPVMLTLSRYRSASAPLLPAL